MSVTRIDDQFVCLRMATLADGKATAMNVVRWLTLGAAAGTWAGFFVGGVTGRIAMLILRLTSDDRLHGVETDDGFTIGEFGAGTVFLMLFCAFFGAFTGIAYVALRLAVPDRWRILVAALVGAVGGGALILHGDGIDFRVLEPLSLAVALFIVVPAVTTAAIAWLVERWDEWWFSSVRRTALMSVPLVFPLFVVAFAVAAATVVVVPVAIVGSRSERLRAHARRYGPLLGRTALLVMASLGGWALANDVTTILR